MDTAGGAAADSTAAPFLVDVGQLLAEARAFPGDTRERCFEPYPEGVQRCWCRSPSSGETSPPGERNPARPELASGSLSLDLVAAGTPVGMTGARASQTALANRREAVLQPTAWNGLLVFLHDGRVEIDSNFVENRIRPLKLTAKNALFAGHRRGRCRLGPDRIADRDLQDERRRAPCLAQEHAGEDRRRPPAIEDPPAPALELRARGRLTTPPSHLSKTSP